MQSALIWFKQGAPAVTLAGLKAFLEVRGLVVRETEWRLESFVVPQLHIASDPPFLVQINDDDHVPEEAEETAEIAHAVLTPPMVARLVECTARFEIGDGNASVVTTDGSVFSFEGEAELDPAAAEVNAVLKAITQEARGIFEDNVNGVWWMAG